MSMNDTHSLERTLDYCEKSNDSFLLNTTADCSTLANNVSISTVTTATGCPINAKAMSSTQSDLRRNNNHKKSHIHFNRLWSVWYGILVTIFQGYLVILGLQKYLGCSLIKWKNGVPVTELSMQLIFCGLTLLFLPLFLASALFKVGNLANDGIKLSSRKGTCTSEQQPVFGDDDGNNSTMKSLWTHGVPISVFIHIITALCLLLPHLLLEAKLIQNQHLPKDNIWSSELDFILKRNDRLVILSFINSSPYQNDTVTSSSNSIVHETHFDDSIESLDYDLNPFETHDSFRSQSLPIPTESIVAPTVFDSVPIQISTYAEDLDLSYEDVLTTVQTLPTTRITTTTSTIPPPPPTTQRTLPPTTITTTQATTLPSTTTSTLPPTTIKSTPSTTIKLLPSTQQIFTEETTLPTTTVTPSTSTTALPTTTTTLSTSTVASTTKLTTTTEAIIITEKTHHQHHHNHRKQHGKTRKNKQKHRQQHLPPPSEFDDFIDDPNLEIKPEKEVDFDAFDREIHMVDSPASKVGGGNVRKKMKNKSSEKMRHSDSMERPRATHKTTTEQAARSRMRGGEEVDESEIHNIFPPSTATTFATENSKIFEIKGGKEGRKPIRKRSIDDDDEDDEREQGSVEENVLLFESDLPSINEDAVIIKEERISPAALISSVPNFTQSTQLEGIGGYLQNILGTHDKFDPKMWFQKSPSLEYLNLALALLVWSVRYPSVFWESSKAFALIFSLQMLINSVDMLLLYVGTSILFKLQVVGQFMTVQNQPSPLLLNGIVTLALTLLAFVLIIASSMILYLYGHSRLSAKIRDCQMITLKDGDLWSYFSHCASLCFILGISVVKAPIIHDLSIVYRMSLDKTIFVATMGSIIHIFLWIIIWLALTAKRQWAFKLPVVVEGIYASTRVDAIQPLLTTGTNGRQYPGSLKKNKGEETIYWPASSPKLKVTFDDELPSTLNDRNLIPDIIEHDGKRTIISSMCTSNGIHHTGEADEGEYATLKTTTQLQISEYDEVINLQRMHHHRHNDNDGVSEDGKLLECVQNESVTYASTRDLEPPQTTTSSIYSHERYIVSAEHHMMSPMAPVTVQVHTEHLTSTPRFMRRGDSGMPPPNEALTPKSDTNSTESSTSPPERALSESSSGVHSSEENKDEVVIRAKAGIIQKTVKTPAVIQEEDIYGRITNNHKMSSFKDSGSACNTLPGNRSVISNEQPSIIDYSQCNTMPLMPGAHQIHRMSANDSAPKQRTTLPNNIRYSSGGHYLRQIPQLKNAESPYATGLGSGHHTFSPKLIQNEPLPPPPNAMMMPQSQSQQQFTMTTSASSSIHHPNVHHFNTNSSSFTGMHHPHHNNSFQMVLNELCANNNNQNANFPPPPPPLSHQMH